MSRTRLQLVFTGHDARFFPYVERVAWALRQLPHARVSGVIPLPRSETRRSALKSPFKHGAR